MNLAPPFPRILFGQPLWTSASAFFPHRYAWEEASPRRFPQGSTPDDALGPAGTQAFCAGKRSSQFSVKFKPTFSLTEDLLFSRIYPSQNKNSRFRQAVEKQRNVTTLEGIEITGWNENEERLIVEAKWAKERDTIDACPKCGSETSTLRKHDWDQQEGGKIRDTPWSGIPVLIRLKQRRYRCSNSDCKKTTVFQHPGVHDKREMTEALVEKIERDSLGPYRFYMLAHQVGSSKTPIREIFERRVEELDRKAKPIPKALGVDGVYIPATGETHAVIADLDEGRVVEMLETDKKPELLKYFHNLERRHAADPELNSEIHGDLSNEEVMEEYKTEIDLEEKGLLANEPHVVVIDMTTRYRDAIKEKLPGATIVVDRYHITRRANLALGRIRIDESRRAGLTAEWKREKEKLEQFRTQLGAGEEFRLEAALNHFPRIKQAYETRNDFLKIFEIRGRQKADEALTEWEESLPKSVEEEFKKFLDGPLSNWREEILNFFSYEHAGPYTNAEVEGFNRAIKQIKTEGAGYSDFDTLRAKVVYGLEKRREMRERGAVGIREKEYLQRVAGFSPGSDDPSDSEEPIRVSDSICEGAPFDWIEEELELW